MAVNLAIPTLGEKFKDYRQDIPVIASRGALLSSQAKLNTLLFITLLLHKQPKATAIGEMNAIKSLTYTLLVAGLVWGMGLSFAEA